MMFELASGSPPDPVRASCGRPRSRLGHLRIYVSSPWKGGRAQQPGNPTATTPTATPSHDRIRCLTTPVASQPAQVAVNGLCGGREGVAACPAMAKILPRSG